MRRYGCSPVANDGTYREERWFTATFTAAKLSARPRQLLRLSAGFSSFLSSSQKSSAAGFLSWQRL